MECWSCYGNVVYHPEPMDQLFAKCTHCGRVYDEEQVPVLLQAALVGELVELRMNMEPWFTLLHEELEGHG